MGQPERYRVVFTKRAEKDLREIMASDLRERALKIIGILECDPFQDPPAYEKLKGRMKDYCSRRLNIEHRAVYCVMPSNDPVYKGIVKIVRMKTHYSGIVPIFFI